MLWLPLLLLGGCQESIDCAVAGELAAPMVPKVLREGDTSNFGRYTESTDVEIPVPPPIGVEAADAFFQDWLHNAAEQRGHNGDKLLILRRMRYCWPFAVGASQGASWPRL